MMTPWLSLALGFGKRRGKDRRKDTDGGAAADGDMCIGRWGILGYTVHVFIYTREVAAAALGT